MGVSSYLAALTESEVRVACVTNHGDMTDYEQLAASVSGSIRLIPGVEISSPEGDFLIFSQDFEYLRTLKAIQMLPERQDRPQGTAVVWAHPFAGIAGGLRLGDDYLAEVAPRVDGIEVHNGNWPDEQATRAAHAIAEHYGLAELGGSDAHKREQLFRCWTETPELGSAAEFVRAVLNRETKAVKLPPSSP